MEFLDQGLRRLMRPAQIKLFLATLVFQTTVFFIGSLYPMSLKTAASTTLTYNNSVQGVYALNPVVMWFYIVSHNAYIVTLELIPFFNIFINVVSMFATGQILHATVITHGVLTPGAGLALAAELYLFPHTIIEYSAYALATSSSILFAVALFRKKESNKEILRNFARGIAGSLFLLAIAGAIEVVIINDALIGALFWFPVLIGIRYLVGWPRSHPDPLNTSKLTDSTVGTST